MITKLLEWYLNNLYTRQQILNKLKVKQRIALHFKLLSNIIISKIFAGFPGKTNFQVFANNF